MSGLRLDESAGAAKVRMVRALHFDAVIALGQIGEEQPAIGTGNPVGNSARAADFTSTWAHHPWAPLRIGIFVSRLDVQCANRVGDRAERERHRQVDRGATDYHLSWITAERKVGGGNIGARPGQCPPAALTRLSCRGVKPGKDWRQLELQRSCIQAAVVGDFKSDECFLAAQHSGFESCRIGNRMRHKCDDLHRHRYVHGRTFVRADPHYDLSRFRRGARRNDHRSRLVVASPAIDGSRLRLRPTGTCTLVGRDMTWLETGQWDLA